MYTHIYQHRRRMAAYCHTQATTAYATRPFLRLASKANLLRSNAAQSTQSKQTQSLQKKKKHPPAYGVEEMICNKYKASR